MVAQSVLSTDSQQKNGHVQAPSSSNNAPLLGCNEIEPSVKSYVAGPVNDKRETTRPQATEILEKARAAIAYAERASAAARAAAELVNVNFGSLKLEEGKSYSAELNI